MIANREIRENAKQALTGSRGRVLGAWILGTLLSSAAATLLSALAGGGIAANAVSVLVTVFLSPITSMGMAFLSLKLVRGENASVGDIFAYMRSGKRYLSALCVSALFTLPAAFLGLFASRVYTSTFDVEGLTRALNEAAQATGIELVNVSDYVHYQSLAVTGWWVALIPVLAIVLVWVFMRLSMVCYLYADAPEDHPFNYFGNSFSVMRGHCWQMLRLQLSLIIRYLIVWMLPVACMTVAMLVGEYTQVLALTLVLAMFVTMIYAIVYTFRVYIPRSFVYPAAFARALMGEMPEDSAEA